MSILDKVRKWIDGETAELVLEEAARDAQIKPRSQAEEFIVKIARAVEEVMQREIVPLPQGKTIIPTEYLIFLSEADDREWQGVKRRGLEEGLHHILSERAREIAGKKKIETKSFAVQLRVDGTLEKGEVRVQHSWDDPSAGKTGVLVRPKPPASGVSPSSAPVVPARTTSPVHGAQQVPPATVSPSFQPPSAYATQQPPQVAGDEPEEMTRVNTRTTELYKLEVWRGGVRQNLIPVLRNEISVGRGSKSKPVDIPLSGDPEISRRHLTIGTDGRGGFWLVNEGRNPAMIGNYELAVGQRVTVTPGTSITVCSYLLRIQPTA